MCTLYWIFIKIATSEETAAHRSVIRFCVELVLTPVETQRKCFPPKGIRIFLEPRYTSGIAGILMVWQQILSLKLEVCQKGKMAVPSRTTSVINTDRHQTVRQVADTVGCGKSTVHRALSGDLSMPHERARWVPRLFMPKKRWNV